MSTIFDKLLNLSRIKKQMIMVFFDMLLLPASLYLSMSLRTGSLLPIDIVNEFYYLFILTPAISIPLFIRNGLYRAVLKYMGIQVILSAMVSMTISLGSIVVVTYMFNMADISRTIIIINWFVTILTVIGSRYVVKAILYSTDMKKMPIAIYGAGKVGSQLVDNLKASTLYNPVAIFDDDSSKWGTVVNSIWVYPFNDLKDLITEKNIKMVLLAMTGISIKERKKILAKISEYPVRVKIITSMENILSEEINIDNVKRVEVEDILGRDPVMPSARLLKKNITGKSIVVTGAGGSIGSELCRQISALKPKKIVLFDHSEFALYNIHKELDGANLDIDIVPVLGTVLDKTKVLDTFKRNAIDTVYHAAAYKHVPMVEMNPLDGIKNNVIGTFNCVRSAIESNIETFILISTDKAVRPTSIMGATKRFSELILQAADSISTNTIFSMVRFGNVLDSAGSVVPLFRNQINKGGPITVTHPDINRYFMSIEEAVQLVIQAGAMSSGGEVFVLEMGEPIKIIDLAKKMINLSGYIPKTVDNLDGDIEIKITGLRPGEKLHEELIIGENVYSTDHPQILKAKEIHYDWDELEKMIFKLKDACASLDINTALDVFANSISGYRIFVSTDKDSNNVVEPISDLFKESGRISQQDKVQPN